MRNFIAGMAVLCLLFLFGCSSSQPEIRAEDLDFTFSCKADIVSNGSNFTCAFSRGGPQNAAVQILSGSGAGITLYWNGNGFTQTYCGLSAKSETCNLPASSFASILVKTFDSAEKTDILTRTTGNEFSGNAENCSFTLTADGNTEKIQTLSVPEWNFTAKFYNYEQPALQTNVCPQYAPD